MDTDFLAAPGTFSKSPKMFGFENDYALTKIGRSVPRGSQYVLDNRDNQLLDWICGLGAIILGYGCLEFGDKVALAVREGAGFSLVTEREHRVAEKLCTLLGSEVPKWDKDIISTRFAKTGTDVTTMAIRLARSVTGKNTVITFEGHYHGWADWSVCRTPPAHGIPAEYQKSIVQLEFGDYHALNRAKYDVAAIIFEYPAIDPPDGYLQALRTYCDNRNALLIVDEVVTGLRWHLGGICGRYGITPDLICMGKALGNGFPISALVGYRKYMNWFARNDPTFCSSTHWGDNVSLAAAEAVLDTWKRDDINWLWYLGEQLMQGLSDAGWNVIGHPPRSVLQFDTISQRAFFIHMMRLNGILMNRPNFISRAHTPDQLKKTVDVAKEIYDQMVQYAPEDLSLLMQGRWPEVLFRGR